MSRVTKTMMWAGSLLTAAGILVTGKGVHDKNQSETLVLQRYYDRQNLQNECEATSNALATATSMQEKQEDTWSHLENSVFTSKQTNEDAKQRVQYLGERMKEEQKVLEKFNAEPDLSAAKERLGNREAFVGLGTAALGVLGLGMGLHRKERGR